MLTYTKPTRSFLPHFIHWNDTMSGPQRSQKVPGDELSSPSNSEIAELNDRDQFIDLAGPETTASKDFRGTNQARCQFIKLFAYKSVRIPAKLNAGESKIQLSFQISGGKLAKKFTITLKVAGANVKKLHECKLEFLLGTEGQVGNLDYAPPIEKCSDAELKNSASSVVVSFMTNGAHVTGLDIYDPAFNEEVNAVLRHMQSLAIGSLAEPVHVMLSVLGTGDIHNELAKLKADSMRTINNNYKLAVPWKPYLCDNSEPACFWGGFPDRKEIEEYSNGIVPVPAKNSFTSTTEAHVVLANGMYLEYRNSPRDGVRSSWPSIDAESVYLKLQLDSLNILFSATASKKIRQWWPVLLNQAVTELRISNPLAAPYVAPRTSVTVIEKIEAAFPWSDDQKDALKMSGQLFGKVGILEGAPGTGKTLILAALALIYASCGLPVLLFGPTTSQARALDMALTLLMDKVSFESKWGPEVLGLYAGCTVFRAPSQVIEAALQTASIVVTTPNAVCSPELLHKFGRDKAKIMILHDDAHLVPESELLATMFAPSYREKVEGLVMTADVKEWPLSIATLAPMRRVCKTESHMHPHEGQIYGRYLECVRKHKAVPKPFLLDAQCQIEYLGGHNEFAEQTGLPLVSRLMRQQFRTYKLHNQHRMPLALSLIPSQLLYGDRLSARHDPSLPDDIKKLHAILREWIGSAANNKPMSAVFIEASKGEGLCIKNDKTTSKHNHRYVDVVYDLVLRIHRAKAIPSDDIKIMTQLKDQETLYEQEFKHRATMSGVKRQDLPGVFTVDALRGLQSRVIIYDLVVTCGDARHGLGILNNEMRANVAATRASDTLIIIGSSELVEIFPDFWQWMSLQEGIPTEPLPYNVEYVVKLKKDGLSFKPPTPVRRNHDEEEIRFKESCKIRESVGHHDWVGELGRTRNYDRN